MARILVRNLEDSVKSELQRRSAKYGMSLQECVRDILRDAAKPQTRSEFGLGSEIVALFAGLDVPEFERLPDWTPEPIDFSGPEYGPEDE